MAVRRTFYFVVILFLAAFIAGRFSNANNAYIFNRLAFVLLLVIGVAAIWTLLSLRGISIERYTRVFRQEVGQIFEERFEIQNHSRFGKLWLEINDLCSLKGKLGSKVVSNISGRQDRSYFARSLLVERGSFLLGPTRVTSGDPFGLFSKQMVIPGEKTLIVLPFLVRLDHFPGPPGRLPGGRALRKKSLEVTPYAAGVREYVPGDPLSRIHWRTTARKDKLMVKEFEQDPHSDVWIMLDCQQGTHLSLPDDRRVEMEDPFWGVPKKMELPLAPDSFEYAVSTAASIASYYMTLGKSVGYASAGRYLNVIPVERGERQLGKILETLAFVRPDGDLPMLGLIEGQARQISRGSTVVLITAVNTNMIILAVDVLLRWDLRPVIVFIDPQSFGSARGIDQLAEQVRQYGAPMLIVKRGDNLKIALELEYEIQMQSVQGRKFN
jgi:uncharacterized protein (DUF58 family)